MRTPVVGVTCMCAAALLTGCGTAASPPSPRPHSPGPMPPSPSAKPQPQGPFAVVVTNANRQGTGYQVLLIDSTGAIVARQDALLPMVKPNQTVDLPLVSASSTKVYYLDGDTDIHSLTPSGATALVKTITAGASAAVTFAVSPDDARVAVAALTEQKDPSKDAGHGYIEDLLGTTNHLDVFNNVSAFSFRWPIGWHGNAVIDALGASGCGPGGYGAPSCAPQLSSYHVVDAGTGNRTATLCETAQNPSQPNGSSDYYTPQGMASAAGTACFENGYNEATASPTQTQTMELIDWAGKEHIFLRKVAPEYSGPFAVNNCSVAPDGSRMACTSTTNSVLTLLDSHGALTSLGRRYSILGWMDSAHLLVGVDSGTLGVLSPDTGTLMAVALANADKVSMVTALPGAL